MHVARRILVLALLAAAAPASASAAPSPLVVTGAAGTMAEVTLDSETVFIGPHVVTTSDHGGWGGVMVVASSGPSPRPYLAKVSMSEAFRCPGSTCPWTIAPDVEAFFGTFESGVERAHLPAGRYDIVLAGPAGAQVTARLTPNDSAGPAVTVATTSKPVSYKAVATDPVGAPGHETAMHSWNEIAPAGKFAVQVLETAYAVDPVGGLLSVQCGTDGENTDPTTTVGGVAPCGDFKGVNFLIPDYGPVGGQDQLSMVPEAVWDNTIGQPETIVPVGDTAQGFAGTTDQAHGMGIDMAVTGVQSSYLRSVYMDVAVD